jgi:hypothetical protein
MKDSQGKAFALTHTIKLGITFAIAYLAIYFIFGKLMGRFALLGTLVIALFFTWLFMRRSWEMKMIEALPEEQRDTFYENVGQIAVAFQGTRMFGDNAVLDNAYLTAIEALTGQLGKEDRNSVLRLFLEAKRNPLEKQLINSLDNMLHTKYALHYKGFRARHYGELTKCVPLPRMYKLVMTTVYDKALKENGLSAPRVPNEAELERAAREDAKARGIPKENLEGWIAYYKANPPANSERDKN